VTTEAPVHVEFPAEGATLRGLLFAGGSQTESERPLVIMAHGTSATVNMVADRYAEVFARAGLAVLLYDHRNFGSSEGEPRQEINPWIQCRGYRDAMRFAKTLGGIDPERIALWVLPFVFVGSAEPTYAATLHDPGSRTISLRPAQWRTR
jgi:uncharacterized protein